MLPFFSQPLVFQAGVNTAGSCGGTGKLRLVAQITEEQFCDGFARIFCQKVRKEALMANQDSLGTLGVPQGRGPILGGRGCCTALQPLRDIPDLALDEVTPEVSKKDDIFDGALHGDSLSGQPALDFTRGR